MPPPGPNTFLVRWGTFLAGSIIVLAVLAVYYNCFSGPFTLDDHLAIGDNPSIRHLGSALSPSSAATTGGRPLLNLTFALNYALGGLNVWGYHAFNLAIHIFAGLTLFGVVRRTLLCRELSECGRGVLTSRLPARKSQISDLKSEMLEPTWLALTVAVLWVVHPLQTESVTYISQRAESLMGLFYLLTLYCFIRGTERRCQVSSSFAKATEDRGVRYQVSEDPKTGSQRLASAFWLPASVTACFLGALCKEVIATAPVIVFLYDRTFIAGSFREAWRLRWRYYLGLAGMWLLLFAGLKLGLHHLKKVGFDQGATWWDYALTSCRSVVLYIKLAFWPHPLVLDYGTNIVQNAAGILPYMLVLAILLAGLLLTLLRWPAVGFAGVWLFTILAPTSSIVPIAGQPMAEHRMYLSLAAIIALLVLGLHRLLGRRSMVAFVAAAVALGWFTIERNKDYGSELAMWKDTVAKCPENARAHYNLGVILANLNQSKEAIAEYEAALRIDPSYAEAHNNLGLALSGIPGRLPNAISHYEAALRIEPDYADAHIGLGLALSEIPGRLPDAISHYEAALQLNPDDAKAHNNLGSALAKIPGRLPEAISHYEAALRSNPDFAEAHNNLGIALAKIPGQLPEAISHFEAALRINPDYADAHYNLGVALIGIPGRLSDAITHFKAALEIDPSLVKAHYNLGTVFLRQGRYSAACGQYEEALKLKPGFVEAHVSLGVTLARMGRLNEAIAQFEAALQIKPDFPPAQKYLEITQEMLLKNGGKDLSEPPAP